MLYQFRNQKSLEYLKEKSSRVAVVVSDWPDLVQKTDPTQKQIRILEILLLSLKIEFVKLIEGFLPGGLSEGDGLHPLRPLPVASPRYPHQPVKPGINIIASLFS